MTVADLHKHLGELIEAGEGEAEVSGCSSTGEFPDLQIVFRFPFPEVEPFPNFSRWNGGGPQPERVLLIP